MTSKQKYVLQLCHDYSIPYLDVARQYASLFKGTEYQLITAYLIGDKNDNVIEQTQSDKVLFLENRSKDLRGLKRKQIKQVKQLCSEYNFDFIIAHRYKAMFISRHINNVPVLGIHHSFGNYLRFMRRWFVNHHYKNLYLLGVSNAIADDIKKYLPNFPQQQIQTLYNRVNIEQVSTAQISPTEARNFLGIADNKYVFANVGRLHPDKDQKTLINAFANVADKLADAILVILGKGRLEKELKQQVQQLKLQDRVFFLGLIPNAINYYKAFDCFVLSSDYEPFGMVLLEAIIAQVPVIATNVGGAKEVVKTKQWLFDVGDKNQLAKLMLEMYQQDKTNRKKINATNNQWLDQNFTDTAVKQAFWKLPFLSPFSSNIFK
jgi:glycosyltransferase involved in cell wall biosynthesis